MASAGCFPLHPLQEMAKRAAEAIEEQQVEQFQQIAGLAVGATAQAIGGPGFLKGILAEIEANGGSLEEDEGEREQDNGKTAGSSGLNGRKTLMAHADVEDLWIF